MSRQHESDEKVLTSNERTIGQKLRYLMGYYWKPLLFGMVVLIAVLGLVFRVFDQRDNVVAVGVYSSAYKRDESKVLQNKWLHGQNHRHSPIESACCGKIPPTVARVNR